MKKIKLITSLSCIVFVVALTSLILLVLPGKNASTTTPTDLTPDTSQNDESYRLMIRGLEEEIQRLNALQEENTKTYEKRVEALSEEVKTLSASLAQARAPEAVPYRYTIKDGYASIVEYIGTQKEVIVPAAIENCPVIEIGQKAFYQKEIERVVLPVTVKKVDWFAFFGCASLSEAEIPASVESIGYAVFDGCKKDFTILCQSDSYAEKYARSYGMNYSIH